MDNEHDKCIPQSLLGFEPPPWYYYGSLTWEVYDGFAQVAVSTKKYQVGWIALGVIIIELLLLSSWYYVRTNIGDKFRLFEFDVPNDPSMIALGFVVTGLVILGFTLAAWAWYRFDLYIWENPRFVFDKTANSLAFNNGKIVYPSVSWQKAHIVRISGIVHTPNMKYKSHPVELIYLFVFGKNDEWQKHLIAFGLSDAEIRKRITRLRQATGFDLLHVQYPPSQTVPSMTWETN